MRKLVERSRRAPLRAEPDAGPLECRLHALRALNRKRLETDVVRRRGSDQRFRQDPVLGLNAGNLGREARELPIAGLREWS